MLVLINLVLPDDCSASGDTCEEEKHLRALQAEPGEEAKGSELGAAVRRKLAEKFLPKLLQLFEWHEHAGANSRPLSLSIMLKTANIFDHAMLALCFQPQTTARLV